MLKKSIRSPTGGWLERHSLNKSPGRGTIKSSEKTAAKAAFKDVPSNVIFASAKKLLNDSKVPSGESWLKQFGSFYGLLKHL